MEREIIQQTVINAVQWVRLGVEAVGAVVVLIGVSIALFRFVRAQLARPPADFNAIRLVLARYLALALEFQLGADILSTAVDPTKDEIIRLGAIAIIRTALNYFLGREMKEEQAHGRDERDVQRKAERPTSVSPE